MLKVLFSAYACQPNRGSEPGVGWNWMAQAARHNRVWVVTREENRASIETELMTRSIPNAQFVFHDLSGWRRLLANLARHLGLGMYLHMWLWQMTATKVAEELHATHGFDVGHHVTYASVRSGSFLSDLELPYIWGPVGGLEEPPLGLIRGLPLRHQASELVRKIVNRLVVWVPSVRRTSQRATFVLGTTPDTADSLSRQIGRSVQVVPNIGVGVVASTPQPHITMKNESLRLIFVGRLVYWKGVDLALEALSRLNHDSCRVEMDVVGDGPDLLRLIEMARKLHVYEKVTFLGTLSQIEVFEKIAKADIFLFPSLHDSGGVAVLEAMAGGLPVVCLDIGGPALSVTETCGIKVFANSRPKVVVGLSEAIEDLVLDHELRATMSYASKSRVRSTYGWELKASLVDDLYQNAIEKGRP